MIDYRALEMVADLYTKLKAKGAKIGPGGGVTMPDDYVSKAWLQHEDDVKNVRINTLSKAETKRRAFERGLFARLDTIIELLSPDDE